MPQPETAKRGPASLDALFALSATLMLGYGSIFALLAEIRDTFGFGESAIGVIGGAGFAAGLTAQVGLARFADRGYGALMLRTGLGLAVLGALAMALSESLGAWIAARMLLGFGSGCVGPAIRRLALAADPAKAGERIGRLSAFDMAGFVLGPVLASGLLAWGGLRAPFFGLVLLLLALAPIALRAEIPGSTTSRDQPSLRTLLRRPPMQASLATGVAFYITVGVFEAIWAIFLADRGGSQLFIALSMSLFTIPMIVVAPRAGALAQRRGPLLVSTFSVATAIGCMLLYGVIDSLALLCVPLAIHAVADAFTMPANQIAIGRASGDEALAAGQGLFGAIGLAVAAVAAVSGGTLYQLLGAAGLWFSSSLAMVFCLVFAWIRGGELRLPHPQAAVEEPA